MRSRARVMVICILWKRYWFSPVRFLPSRRGLRRTRLSLGDVCQVISGAAALGFGLWHFAVPSSTAGGRTFPMPSDSRNSGRRNKLLLQLFAFLDRGHEHRDALITDAAEPISLYWRWANVGLWTARVVYQLVKPQEATARRCSGAWPPLSSQPTR